MYGPYMRRWLWSGGERFFFHKSALSEVFFVLAEEYTRPHQADYSECANSNARWARYLGYFAAQQVGTHCITTSPTGTPQCIKEHEPSPVHITGTGKQRDKNTQD